MILRGQEENREDLKVSFAYFICCIPFLKAIKCIYSYKEGEKG